jgi:hypothetical protein
MSQNQSLIQGWQTYSNVRSKALLTVNLRQDQTASRFLGMSAGLTEQNLKTVVNDSYSEKSRYQAVQLRKSIFQHRSCYTGRNVSFLILENQQARKYKCLTKYSILNICCLAADYGSPQDEPLSTYETAWVQQQRWLYTSLYFFAL